MTTAVELNAELRDLLEVVRTSDFATVDTTSLTEITEVLADIRKRLEPHVVPGVRMQATLHGADRHGGEAGQLPDLEGVAPEDFFPYSPIVGPLNPVSPMFKMWFEGDEVRGIGQFGSVHNGPPAGAHGGHVAAVLDEVMGLTGVFTGNHGFTGTLNVRYENLTPLHTDVSVRGWVERTEGRKSYIAGEIRHGDTICATCEGLFIRPRV